VEDDPCRPVAMAAGEAAPTTLSAITEEAHVGRRTLATGRVRVTRTLRQHERLVELPAAVRSTVEVERVAIGRPVERPEPPRVEGDVTVIPVYEEVAIVTRQWILKEELRVRTVRHSEPQAPQPVTLRAQELDVQREDVASTAPDVVGTPQDKHNKT
jgi:stress response protein YsnF